MRLSFLTIMLLFCTSIFSQQFQCEKMHDDIKKWNEIKQPKNNTKWANAIVSNKLFQQNSDGSLNTFIFSILQIASILKLFERFHSTSLAMNFPI